MHLKEIWKHTWGALRDDKHPERFSIKKCTTALFAVNIVIMTWVYVDKNNFLAVLGELLGFILFILGVRAWEKGKLNSENKPNESNP